MPTAQTAPRPARTRSVPEATASKPTGRKRVGGERSPRATTSSSTATVSSDTASSETASSAKTPSAAARLRARAEAVLARKIDYIHNAEFEDAKLAREIEATPLIEEGTPGRRARRPPGLPNYLAGLYEVPLLTPKHEAALFRKMNYLKYAAEQERSKLRPARPGKRRLERVEWLLAEEKRVRNRIARCNLRLVVSIARKFADLNVSFDEFVSEGNVALLHAVAKFDYGRGFRFSTYATHAIRRAYYRMVQQRKRRNTRMVLGTGEIIGEASRETEQVHLTAGQYADYQQLMSRAMDTLDERERLILTARFGLEELDSNQTLQSVAGRLGICKERVRQLQNRAIGKLRDIAYEMRMEAPVL